MQPLRANTDTDPRTYTVSVSFERFDSPDAEEATEHGMTIEGEDYDCEQLQSLAQDHGITEASCSHLPDGGVLASTPWFRSTSPREDRAYYERGEQLYFALHLNMVDGRPPTAADVQRVGDYLGIAFANRVDDDEQPDARARPGR